MLICFDHKKRKSTLRLSCHDYSSAGFYFVTICTRDREHFLGEIIKGEMILSDIGYIIADRWHALPDYFPDIQLDEFIVMPNHIHGILIKSYLTR